MISRRNIRIKVMQTLYTTCTLDKNLKPADTEKILLQHFDDSRSLLIYCTWFLTEIALYAATLAQQRAAKHLPTEEDLKVNTKISGNEVIRKILEDPLFVEQLKLEKPELKANRELIRKIYLQLLETPEYKSYTSENSRQRNEEKRILEFILNDCLLTNELFLGHIEDLFTNWDDDAEMIIQLLTGYIQKPGSYNFNQMIPPDKKQFAKDLLRTVREKDNYLQELIIPKLKNWDPERIALLDMLMMKMGVAEFLYFDTIPPKVTINEYIDLAKEYSTQQSGQFVNGILDNIHKDLVGQGKMQKVDYKKA